MIENRVITEPIANVETPETPCPIVQPERVLLQFQSRFHQSYVYKNHAYLQTTPPSSCCLRLNTQMNLAIVENSAATPKVKKKLSNILLVNKSASPIGFINVNDCTPTAG